MSDKRTIFSFKCMKIIINRNRKWVREMMHQFLVIGIYFSDNSKTFHNISGKIHCLYFVCSLLDLH